MSLIDKFIARLEHFGRLGFYLVSLLFVLWVMYGVVAYIIFGAIMFHDTEMDAWCREYHPNLSYAACYEKAGV